MFICGQSFSFIGSRLCLWVVILIGRHLHLWVGGCVLGALTCASGSSSSMLLFVIAVAVLGVGLSFVGTSSVFVAGGAYSWAVYVLHGWGGVMFVGSGCHTHMGSHGSVMCGVAAISSWCCDCVSLYVAPASGCEEEMEKGGEYLLEKTRW